VVNDSRWDSEVLERAEGLSDVADILMADARRMGPVTWKISE